MQEVEEVCRGRAEAFDRLRIEYVYRIDEHVAAFAAETHVEKRPERALVLGMLVDVWNAQFRLPEKRVVGALEQLPLFVDGANDSLE